VAQVVALDEAFGTLDVVEELDGEAERVDDADGVADTGRAFAFSEAPYRSAESAEELLRLVDVLGSADPVPRRQRVSASSYWTWKPSMSTQNQRAAARSVTASWA
jgi:hypothetical protein